MIDPQHYGEKYRFYPGRCSDDVSIHQKDDRRKMGAIVAGPLCKLVYIWLHNYGIKLIPSCDFWDF